jgi:hypothetical protein
MRTHLRIRLCAPGLVKGISASTLATNTS